MSILYIFKLEMLFMFTFHFFLLHIHTSEHGLNATIGKSACFGLVTNRPAAL